jgi:hypothetical protein
MTHQEIEKLADDYMIANYGSKDGNKPIRDAFIHSLSVNHPEHYGGQDNPYEAIKVIEAWGLCFHLGNVAKYIARCGKKDAELQELKKAKWYLDRKIQLMEGWKFTNLVPMTKYRLKPIILGVRAEGYVLQERKWYGWVNFKNGNGERIQVFKSDKRELIDLIEHLKTPIEL